MSAMPAFGRTAQGLLVVTMLGGGVFAPAAAQEKAAPAAPVKLAPVPPDAEIERFLKAGRIVDTEGTKKGITGSTRATLDDGKMRHDAHIQTIDEYKREFRSDRGVEFDFRDSWTFNVAAYKIDRLIGLNMVPVSVPGHYRSQSAAYTWWIDDVMMDEGDRMKKKVEAPDKTAWGRQMQLMRLFDELIANVDRNLGNMVYSKDWRLWPIDHTRAFRKNTTLRHNSYVTRCDRQVFERLKALDRDTLKREVGKYLDDGQIKTLLTRRDLIVKKLESLGPSALFDREQQVVTQ